MHIQFRQGTQGDIESLAALSRSNISEIYASFLGAEAVSTYLVGAVGEYLAENLTRCTVMVADGAVVGFSVSRRELIDLMMIDPRFQRCGLGSALLHHVEDMLFQSHAVLKLESFKDNTAAIAFYRKNGWREIRAFKDEPSGIEKVEFQKRGGSRPSHRKSSSKRSPPGT